MTKEGSFVCFNNLGFEPKHVQVTTYRIGGGTSDHIPNAVLDDFGFCDGPEQAAGQLVNASDAGPVAGPRFCIARFR